MAAWIEHKSHFFLSFSLWSETANCKHIVYQMKPIGPWLFYPYHLLPLPTHKPHRCLQTPDHRTMITRYWLNFNQLREKIWDFVYWPNLRVVVARGCWADWDRRIGGGRGRRRSREAEAGRKENAHNTRWQSPQDKLKAVQSSVQGTNTTFSIMLVPSI